MRVLVLEDNHRVAAAIVKGLSQERFVVDVVHHGDEAFDLASTEPYDVLVLDIMVPGKDGVTVSRELRENNIKTPILLLTALGEIEQRVTGLEAGADDYLPKPFAFEELVARVRALGRRQPLQHTDLLTLGSLVLDVSTGTVTRFGQLISLSQKEFSLLQSLMMNPGHVFSKDQLLQKVWNFDATVLPNTVEATIKNLRKKIETPFSSKQPLIETVRGFGYRISHDS